MTRQKVVHLVGAECLGGSSFGKITALTGIHLVKSQHSAGHDFSDKP